MTAITNVDKMISAHEARLEQALSAAIDGAAAAVEINVIAAILGHAVDDGATDHERDQLAVMLGTDGMDSQPVADALDAAISVADLASFFAAVLALATAGVGHVANTNAADVATAKGKALGGFRATFLRESTIAIRETTERMLHAIGDAGVRAAQIRRVLGLSSAQARGLEAIRQQLYTAIATGNQADPETMLAFARGHLSGAQLAMLGKALRSGVTVASAEALLDRHAKAMRTVRIKATAGNATHGIAEAAKLAGWQIAQRFGALPADQRRFWQTAGDERVRSSHAVVPGLNPLGVALGDPFHTPLGDTYTPPLEHGCRCRAVLRLQ